MLLRSIEQLKKVSIRLAEKLRPNDTIFLEGEIGSGKTTLCRYLINHLQKKNKLPITNVPSPTFNIVYEYFLKNTKVMHYDLYRINNVNELKNLDLPNDNKKEIKIIEWPNLLKKKFNNKIEIKIKFGKKTTERVVNIKGHGKLKEFNINEI